MQTAPQKRKKREKSATGQGRPSEALRSLFEQRRISHKINYAVLNELNDPSTTTPLDSTPAAATAAETEASAAAAAAAAPHSSFATESAVPREASDVAAAMPPSGRHGITRTRDRPRAAAPDERRRGKADEPLADDHGDLSDNANDGSDDDGRNRADEHIFVSPFSLRRKRTASVLSDCTFDLDSG